MHKNWDFYLKKFTSFSIEENKDACNWNIKLITDIFYQIQRIAISKKNIYQVYDWILTKGNFSFTFKMFSSWRENATLIFKYIYNSYTTIEFIIDIWC